MKPSVLTIGNFDGVHLGHQALIRAGRALADQTSSVLIALTFDPHPAQLLAPSPGRAPLAITDLSTRIDLLKAAGADHVQTIVPTRQLLLQEPEAFVKQLIDTYRMAGIVEGPDFHFGHNRRGDLPMLRLLGAKLGFQVIDVPPVHVELSDHTLVEVRSTLVRWLLSQGRVIDAARCLGRPFSITSKVVTGEQRGRTLGVPTANLSLAQLANQALPADGVYAGVARLPSGQAFPAAISLGTKPSFGVMAHTLEAHLLGFSGDLYDTTLTLEFHRWVREQSRFPSVDLLKAQLSRDIAGVASWHARVDP
jgi:riboflavin kinase / FMN adenylyltransferase